MADHLKKCVDDFQPLLKLENHHEQRKMMPLQKTAKERKERGSEDESQFVIMALIPCQVSFNMKKRVYSAYTERKNRAKKRREEEGRKKKEGRGRMRENRRGLM